MARPSLLRSRMMCWLCMYVLMQYISPNYFCDSVAGLPTLQSRSDSPPISVLSLSRCRSHALASSISWSVHLSFALWGTPISGRSCMKCSNTIYFLPISSIIFAAGGFNIDRSCKAILCISRWLPLGVVRQPVCTNSKRTPYVPIQTSTSSPMSLLVTARRNLAPNGTSGVWCV